MTAANFEPSLKIILREEGGNDDDPHDHGGRTSRGIIQREWNAFRKTHPGRPSDVWKAPDEDIKTIYHDQYWEPYCDWMPTGVDLCFFNTAVNSGRQQAVKELQRAIGVNNVDGMMGIVTKNTLLEYNDIEGLIKILSNKRRAYYRALRQFPRYGRGWLARTDRVEKAALAMAATATPPEHIATNYEHVDTIPTDSTYSLSAKAAPTDPAKPVVSQETGVAMTTSSSIGSGIVAQLQDATSALQPFQGTIKIVTYILIAVAIVSFGLTIYAIWKNHNVQKAI